MSVARTRICSVKYRINPKWQMDMIPWHRQLISLIYGIGVIMIALWALEQGQGPYVVLGVVGMSMLTFGVEISEVHIGNVGYIEFTDTSAGDKSDNDSNRRPETPDSGNE